MPPNIWRYLIIFYSNLKFQGFPQFFQSRGSLLSCIGSYPAIFYFTLFGSLFPSTLLFRLFKTLLVLVLLGRFRIDSQSHANNVHSSGLV